MVSKVPGKFRIKLADFGVSKRVSNRGTTALRTRAGTAAYMAPEVVRRWEEEEKPGKPRTSYNQKVDLWSVGCIIFALDRKVNLFTGVLMSKEQTCNEIDSKLQTIGLETDGAEFMKQLLEFNPTDRPTAEEALKKYGWLIYSRVDLVMMIMRYFIYYVSAGYLKNY